ncbi:MAG: four helix bundle protein [Saprospiraceae bacterium]
MSDTCSKIDLFSVELLIEVKKEYMMSKQLLKAGTNPGAMVRESENAESDNDFIHKLGVAQKETGETQYWLELLYENNYLTKDEFESIYPNTIEVIKLLKSQLLLKSKKLVYYPTLLVVSNLVVTI